MDKSQVIVTKAYSYKLSFLSLAVKLIISNNIPHPIFSTNRNFFNKLLSLLSQES